jgi:hypothetical protein
MQLQKIQLRAREFQRAAAKKAQEATRQLLRGTYIHNEPQHNEGDVTSSVIERLVRHIV